jgi:hypothetical protein
MQQTLPAIFWGHGNPMNALQINTYTEAWRRIGETNPKPKAILSISAHGYVPKTEVTVSTAPRTITISEVFRRSCTVCDILLMAWITERGPCCAMLILRRIFRSCN